MIRSVVISILLGRDVIAYLRQQPTVGDELIAAIIAEIDASKQIRLNRYQVKIVLGALDNGGKPGRLHWQQFTLAWDQYYIYEDDSPTITKVMDNGIRSIVKRLSQAFLDRFYIWSGSMS